MSVCIVVICQGSQAIVAVSDAKVGFGDYSADYLAKKNVPIYPKWNVLFAGDDVEHAQPIIDRAGQLLHERKHQHPNEVANAVDQAYGERLHEEINRKVLRKRGFTVDTFREEGKAKCTPTTYLDLCSRIDRIKFLCNFSCADLMIKAMATSSSSTEKTPRKITAQLACGLSEAGHTQP